MPENPEIKSGGMTNEEEGRTDSKSNKNNNNAEQNNSSGSADLLGLGLGGEVNNVNGNGFTAEPVTNNLNK